MTITQPKLTNTARYKCLEFLKKHSVDLYLNYCGKQICDPGHTYGPIARDEYLLHYIISGRGRFTVDGRVHELDRHKAFLIHPGIITEYCADTGDPWTYIWIGFNGIKAETSLKYANLDRENPVGEFQSETPLIACVDEMLKSSKLTYANELRREGCLFTFLSILIQEVQESDPDQNEVYDYPSRTYVEHALEFIDHHYSSNIRVSDIADYIGINRSYLSGCFRKHLNTSPQEYIINFRMDRACALLETSEYTIQAIASEVGYEDPLTFSKTFKSFRGLSPTEYRKKKIVLTISEEKQL